MIDPVTTPTTRTGGADVLPRSEPASLGLDPARLEQLYAVVEGHIAAGRYPGAQIAIARHGRLGAFRTFGEAKIGAPATDDTLWLLFSQTKMITAAALWQLVDQGALSFADRVADHIPEFARHGKGEVTVYQLLTHQGGFPNARPGPEVWDDHARLREAVCDFTLEWTPGSQTVYHGASAHWVAAVLIETLTGRDYRDVIRRDLLDPLGLGDVFVGVPEEAQARCADMHELRDGRMVAAESSTSPAFRAAGVPGGGGYATAAGMAAFYQMLLGGGSLNGVRVLSPRVVQFATRNHSGDRPDTNTGIVQSRGMTPATKGAGVMPRAMGSIAPQGTFGHGGAGSSYSWGDPESGLSFTYLSNARLEDPWHTRRLDQLSTLVHAALVEP
ncbi:MAG TPA: serine hydrolase domain-containing protein [Chloroflexota bacterium]|nr:serine hydrolase domain-containing protein [Chloroflexota bacterium]